MRGVGQCRTHTERELDRIFVDHTLLTRGLSLDPVQLTQMAKYLETVYVSGWQSSSTASSSNEPGPDLAGKVEVASTPLNRIDQITHFDRLPVEHCSQQGRTPIHGPALP